MSHVTVPAQLAGEIVDSFEHVDPKLARAVACTFSGPKTSDGQSGLLWTRVMAVRVQMNLVKHKLPLANVMGRYIDVSLSRCAMGSRFEPWVKPSVSTFTVVNNGMQSLVPTDSSTAPARTGTLLDSILA